MDKLIIENTKKDKLIKKTDIELVKELIEKKYGNISYDYKLNIFKDCLELKYNTCNKRYITRNIIMISYWLGISKEDYKIKLEEAISKNNTLIKEKEVQIKEIEVDGLDISNYSSSENIGYIHSNIQSSNIYADNVLLSASRGHGFAAEKANNMYDKLTGKNATIIGGDNELNGADRLVNGVKIQTKYCKTGSKCVGECFENNKLRYLNSDGTPMKIEVPSDKYESAVKAMENRIKEGQVPGVTDPKEARNIIKKGQFTYQQARNIARFGTIESITYDAINGVKIASTSLGISAAITFAYAIWNGENIEGALESAIYSGIKVGGISFISTIITSQLGRTGIEQSLRPATDYLVKQIGPKATSNIVNSLRIGAKPIYGVAATNNLSKLLRGNIVANTATLSILSIADISRLAKGQISEGQAFKNITSTAAGIAGGTVGYSGGALIGASIGSVIPVVGTAVGAVVGGLIGGMATGSVANKVTKSTLDNFIEDDAKAMLKIIEVQFVQVAQDFLLNEIEIKQVSEKLQNLDLFKEMRVMYSSNDRNKFAYNLIEKIAIEIFKKRKKIELPSDENVLKAIGELAS